MLCGRYLRGRVCAPNRASSAYTTYGAATTSRPERHRIPLCYRRPRTVIEKKLPFHALDGPRARLQLRARLPPRLLA